MNEGIVHMNQLNAKNLYESQVLSGFDNYTGIKMNSYKFPHGTDSQIYWDELECIKLAFYERFKCGYFKLNEKKNYHTDASFEVDQTG